MSIQQVLHPERYHGHGRRPPFFEGWYFKVVDASQRHVYAFIPGIFLHKDGRQSHSFVQVLEGGSGASHYHVYPVDAFSADRDAFDVVVGPNRFRREAITLDLNGEGQRIRGELGFTGQHPWPITLGSPGAMGPLAWLPFLECYHGVLSMDHRIQGSLTMDGQAMDFSGGRGYLEKDWGKSFPSGWVWLQSNHFGQPGISLMASVAHIPFLGLRFPGFIIALLFRGTLHRFATYTGARVSALAITEKAVSFVVTDRKRRLEISATRAHAGLLHGPSRTDMSPRVMESLRGEISLRFFQRQGRDQQLVFQGTGRHAGVEVNGDIQGLLTQIGAHEPL